ncbi:MAG: rhodanese-like domain-containing protein [Bacteroidota bacterium]
MGFFDIFKRRPTLPTLSAAEFVAQRASDALVLDVRTPGEFAQGHLTGARNVNVMAGGFDAQIEALGLDKDAPVYLYCRSGHRSGQAQRRLAALGFAQPVNVGSFSALKQAGASTSQP